MKSLVVVLLLVALGDVDAKTWNCRNADMEIACSETDCSALLEHDFTPMDVAFNDDGEVFICAYSGCWEGQGSVNASNGFLSITAVNLVYSTDPNPGEMRGRAAILLDLEDNVALLKLGAFAQPLNCRTLE